MRITSSIQPLVETLLIKQKWLTLEELQTLYQHTHPKQTLAEILIEQGILSATELNGIIQQAKQFQEKKEQISNPTPSQFQTAQKQIGNYQIIEKIAQGGMGIVYKAFHKELKHTVALKLLLTENEASTEAIARFNQEAKLTAKLRHPNIVQILDSGKEAKQHYFAMEFIEGETLEQWFSKPKISLRKKVELIQQILEALHFAHQQNIIHRDLKPDNIFITADGTPKIGDFGLAKKLKEPNKAQQLTQTGKILGTPMYMSPEQISGENKTLDATTDIYSIGICLYELLTNQCPFQGKTIHELFYKIITQEPLHPSKINPNIHQDLNIIILKAIEKEKRNRYQSTKEFAEDLARFLNGFPIHARPKSYHQLFFKALQRKRKALFVGSIIFCICLFIMVFKKMESLVLQQQLFQAKMLEANSEKKRSTSISTETTKERFRKMEALLKSFSLYKEANSIISNNKKLQQKHSQTGQELITLTCQNQEFALANYIAKEMQQISLISTNEFQVLRQKIAAEKTRKSTQHLTTLKHWEQALKTKKLSNETQKDIIFEISKMPEEEIVQKLLQFLAEGTQYFLQNPSASEQQIQFYGVMTTALGRIGSPSGAASLFESLKKLADFLCQKSPGKRPLPPLNFMVQLAQALGNSNAIPYGEKLNKIRIAMKEYGIFWSRTKSAYKKLLAIELQYLPAPSSSKDFQKRATNFFIQGNYLEAIKDYNQAIKLKPNIPVLYLERGLSKNYLQDYSGALQDYQKVIELKPDEASAYNRRGLIKLKQKRFSAAIQDFDQAIKIDPFMIRAFNNRGIAKVNQHKKREALLDFNQAIQLNPQYLNALSNRGLLKIQLGDLSGAFEDSKKLLKLHPQSTKGYLIRAIINEKKGKIAQAISGYNQAIKLDPNLSNAYLNRGKLKWEQKDIQGAILDYNQALELKPDYLLAYFNRARARDELKEYKAALEDYSAAIRLQPDWGLAYSNRGQIKYILSDYNGALLDYNKAIKIEPNLAHYYHLRAQVNDQLGYFKNAIQDLTLTMKLAPKSKSLLKERGILYLKDKKYNKAFADFQKAMKRTPKDATIIFFLGKILLHKGEQEKALIHFIKAARINPKYSKAHFEKGYLLEKLNQKDAAIKSFEKGLKLKTNPKASIALFELYFERIKTKLRTNQMDSILEDIEKASKLVPLGSNERERLNNMKVLFQRNFKKKE